MTHHTLETLNTLAKQIRNARDSMNVSDRTRDNKAKLCMDAVLACTALGLTDIRTALGFADIRIHYRNAAVQYLTNKVGTAHADYHVDTAAMMVAKEAGKLYQNA
jgi:hypothetical protein